MCERPDCVYLPVNANSIPLRSYLLAGVLGVALVACGETGSEDASSMSPVVAQYLQRGSQALEAQRFRRALAFVDSASRIGERSPDAEILRGRIYSEMGHFEKADSAYALAAQLDEDYRGVWLNRGNTAYRMSEYREAIKYYHRELDHHPRAAPWRGIGRAYVELGVPDSAEWAFKKALAADSTYAPAYHSLALLYEDEGEFEKALRYARQALRRDTANTGFEYQVGELALRNGREREALRHLVEVRQDQPWHQGAHYNIGRALTRLGREEKAKEFMDRAEELRQLESKIQHLQSTVRSVPDDPYAHAALGSALRRAGRNEEAMHAYKIAAYLDPTFTDVRNNIANLYLVQHDTSRAIQEYRSILRQDSSLVEIWTNLGVVYALSGREDQARAAWQEALERDPDHARASKYLRRIGSGS